MLNHILDHVARAKARLIQQYKGKSRIEGTVQVLVDRLQSLENVFQDLMTMRSIDDAVGVQLDRAGAIAGIDRELGQSDADYRFQIKAKIVRNLNEGTPEEVISAARFFLNVPENEPIWYQEVYPASVDIFSHVVVPEEDRVRIRDQLERFLPAGVKLGSFGQFDSDNPFIFNGGSGFGDVNDPSKGGLLADLYG